MKGKADLAFIDYSQAIELAPNYALAYCNRAVMYQSRQENDKAIDDCNKALELFPYYAHAFLTRGSASFNKGAYDSAIADYSSAIELYPEYFKAFINRGASYTRKGDYQKAFMDYKKALQLYPYDAFLYRNISDLFFRQKDYGTALKYIKKAIKLDPMEPDGIEKKGKILLHMERRYKVSRHYNERLRILKRRLTEQPSADYYWNNAVWYALFVPKLQDAENYAKKGLELFPSYAPLHSNLGHAYMLQEKKEDALNEYELFIENYKPNPKEALKEDFSLLKMRYPKKAALIDEAQKALGIE